MRKFKLTIAYEGSAYHGWQSQKSGRGVQDSLELALARIFPSNPKLTSSSRTDTGVHAYGLVAHFEIPKAELKMPLRHLVLAINALLPDDIRVRSAGAAPAGFNARFDAIRKQYRYTVWNHPVMNPLLRSQAWHVPRALDLAVMRSAASHLTGRHDFRSFTANRGGVLDDPVRTLTRCDIKRNGHRLTFIIEGEGFLYKMCRTVAGTLIQAGEGRFTPGEVAAMLESRSRSAAGMTAPPQGLVLWKVFYRKSPS